MKVGLGFGGAGGGEGWRQALPDQHHWHLRFSLRSASDRGDELRGL